MTRSWSDQARAGNDTAVAEDDLQAYVDGQLDGGRRAVIEAYLAANPREAERVAAYRAQNIGLHALFDPRPGGSRRDHEVPPRIAALAGALQARLGRSPRHATASRRLRNLAASVALLAAAGAAGWLSLNQAPPSSAPPVTSAPQPSLQPVATAGQKGASAGRHEVAAWLAGRGNRPITVPRLENLGFQLTGEDIIESENGPAARFYYEDANGQRVTLTMRAGGTPGKSDFTFLRGDDSARFVWQDAHMAYSLTGGLGEDKLQQLAEAISQSLTADPPTTTQAAGDASGAASAMPPAEPESAPEKPAPAIDKIPLIPVPLSDEDAPKET